MISARVASETEPELLALALKHQEEEIGHNTILASGRSDDKLIWDPIIEAAVDWFVGQLTRLPGVLRAVLAHLVLEAGSLVFSQAGLAAFPDSEYFSLHDEADLEHMEMGYELLRQRADWIEETVITVLDRAWQMITVVSDHIAERAQYNSAAALT
jgi:hypothetical protein